MQNHSCPYCGTVIEPTPKRKMACPSCGEIIVVRQGLLMTQAAERMALMVRYHIEQREYLATEKVLAKKFERVPPPRDVVWSILDEKGRMAEKMGDYQQMIWAYNQLALFLNDEGRDASDLIKREARWNLMDEKAHGSERVMILTAGDEHVCDQCRLLHGKTLDISEALESMPILPLFVHRRFGLADLGVTSLRSQ